MVQIVKGGAERPMVQYAATDLFIIQRIDGDLILLIIIYADYLLIFATIMEEMEAKRYC